jgi:hypothetical protein
MPEILDVFGKVAKQKDVVLADFTCDLDLSRQRQQWTY